MNDILKKILDEKYPYEDEDDNGIYDNYSEVRINDVIQRRREAFIDGWNSYKSYLNKDKYNDNK